MSCEVSAPGGSGASYYACTGIWPDGPSETTAFFYVSHHLLHDGNSPTLYWSDARCPNIGAYACVLPIFAYSPLTVAANFTYFGTPYSFEAEANYELGW